MTKAIATPRTRKVRRRSAGGKPSGGWKLQREGRKVRRANVRNLRIGEPDARLTTVGGLVSFNAYVRELGRKPSVADVLERRRVLWLAGSNLGGSARRSAAAPLVLLS
jgi:hypothetical protein